MPRPERAVTAGELQRLTGAEPERLRTWARRYAFPSTLPGRREHSASEVPRVIAAMQLVAADVPATAAVSQARRWTPESVDIAPLEQVYARLDTPVMAYCPTEPMTVVYRNAAATDHGAGPDLLRDDGRFARDLRRIAIGATAPAQLLWLPACWPGEEQRTVALRLAAPISIPAVVVVMAIPATEPGGRGRDAALQAERRLRSTTLGLTRARRELQTKRGRRGVMGALTHLADGIGATDGFLAFDQRGALCCARSIRQAMHPPRIRADAAGQIAASTAAGAPAWLEDPLPVLLDVHGGSVLAIPLVSESRPAGYAFLRFPGRFAVEEPLDTLLMAFATMLAAAIQLHTEPPATARPAPARSLGSHAELSRTAGRPA